MKRLKKYVLTNAQLKFLLKEKLLSAKGKKQVKEVLRGKHEMSRYIYK